MKLSKSFWQTYKEVPHDAEIPSHQLLMRAGFIHKTGAGLYSYLPMATKVLRKIENIIREELDKIGAQETRMAARRRPLSHRPALRSTAQIQSSPARGGRRASITLPWVGRR